MSGHRCCGRAWFCTHAQSVGTVRVRPWTRRLSALSAVLGLALVAPVTAAQAEDAPPPPVLPTMPAITVQVSVSVPGVTVSVQAGTVDVSVSTETVDVSVSVTSEDTVEDTGPAPSGEQQPAARNDDSSNCCSVELEQAAPAAASPKKRRAAPAAAPERLAQPTIGTAAKSAPARPVPSPRVDHSTHVPIAKQAPVRTTERRTTTPKAPRRCCERAQARIAIAAAPIRLGPPPRADSWLRRYELAGVRPAALPAEVARDNRLLLQLGVLVAFLYLLCLAGWFSATRLGRRRA